MDHRSRRPVTRGRAQPPRGRRAPARRRPPGGPRRRPRPPARPVACGPARVLSFSTRAHQRASARHRSAGRSARRPGPTGRSPAASPRSRWDGGRRDRGRADDPRGRQPGASVHHLALEGDLAGQEEGRGARRPGRGGRYRGGDPVRERSSHRQPDLSEASRRRGRPRARRPGPSGARAVSAVCCSRGQAVARLPEPVRGRAAPRRAAAEVVLHVGHLEDRERTRRRATPRGASSRRGRARSRRPRRTTARWASASDWPTRTWCP